MKMVSINRKPYSHKCVLAFKLLIIFSLVNISSSLYEDQIGKFDLRRSFIGKIKDGFFDTNSDLILASTEENVIAGLNMKTGAISWRQAFELQSRGILKYSTLYTDTKYAPPQSTFLSVSGNSPVLIRGWNPETGNLLWEWSLTSTHQNKDDSFWFVDNLMLYHILPFWNSHLEVTQYYASNGQQIKQGSSKINTVWIKKENCVLAQPYLVCSVQNKIIGVNLISEKGEIITKTVSDEIAYIPIVLKGLPATVIVNNEIISLDDNIYTGKIFPNTKICVKQVEEKNILLQIFIDNNQLKVLANDLSNGEVLHDLNVNIDYPNHFGIPEIIAVQCKRKSEGLPLAYRILISTSDGGVLLLQQGKLKWIREESLANIVAVEMIELPLSDEEGSIEKEFNSKDGDFLGAFTRRISSQFSQIIHILTTVFELSTTFSTTQGKSLTRDSFGLHKMIIALTSSGKIFGIDNISGNYHWIKYLPDITNFNSEQKMQLLIQRTSKHFPHPPQYAIIAKNKWNGNGLVYQFDPITGQTIENGVIHLDYNIQQIAVLHEIEPHFLRGILILDQDNKAHVIPKNSIQQAHGMYLYTVKNSGIITGYFIEVQNSQLIKPISIWEINLGGASNTQKVMLVAAKNSIEHVHSQGRVLGDRSVLYKYINPNLIAVATHGTDSIHKYILNVHLIDVVSGSIVFSMSHRKAKSPFHMVHSENWLVYSYYNEKVRRTEITTIELYEGKTQTNSTVWSSLEAPPLPMVERQSYILPSNVAALRETITEKGITNKDVLFGLTNGAIVELPWAVLDPRRPVTTLNQAREEGIIPYMPELPLPSENVINYNQSVTRIKGIYTAPSGLESTCLVIAYGLDIFVTRVAPSKTFDLLKEDFDYFLISIVLMALTTASYIVKHLSSRKAVKQAWK